MVLVSAAGTTRCLVVWCPDWPVTAAGMRSGGPAAIVEGNVVSAANQAARVEGVHAGQRRRLAEACCPGLQLRQRDHGEEARAFEAVLKAVESVSPEVEAREPGCCALYVRGPSRRLGGEDALIGALGRALGAVVPGSDPLLGDAGASGAAGDEGAVAGAPGRGAPTEMLVGQRWWRIGAADGPTAARLAAREGLVVPVDATPGFLARIPLAALQEVVVPEVPRVEALAQVLGRLGIRTLGDLASLPEQDVLGRFGQQGLALWRLAHGGEHRALVPRRPQATRQELAELDPPIEDLAQMAFVVRALAVRLQERLAAEGVSCTGAIVELETEHGERRARRWAHAHVLRPELLVERVRWQLEGWWASAGADRPTGGLVLARLVADEVMVGDGRQLGFWGDATDAQERAERALARVQGMLGERGVLVGLLAGGRDPSERGRLVPWGGIPEPFAPLRRPWPGHLPAPAPALVPGGLRAIEVLDAAGQPVGVDARGQPSAIPATVVAGTISRRRSMAVRWWAGPWPIEERWWQEEDHRRRARLQIVLEDGQAWLVSLERGQWRCEGLYD